MQYIHENKKEKILLIANEKEAQNSYKTGLPDRIILHNTVDKSDYVVRDFKEAISSLTEEQNVLCITKSKFNRLLITRPNSLSVFDKIIIDEQNGLNPISLDDINSDVGKILSCIQPFMSIKATEYFDNMISIVSFLRDIKLKYEREESLLFYQETVPKEMQIMALSMLNNIRRLYDNEKIYGIAHIEILFNILNCMANDTIYLGDMYFKTKHKKIFMLFANTFLKDFVKMSNATIKILDGTAKEIKVLYDWLGIRVKSDYKCNDKLYPNLKFHIHRYKNLVPSRGRNSIDYTEKIVEDIIKLENNTNLTFTINKFKEEEIFTKNFPENLLDYSFSGRDVGFNGYRDLTEMNVIYYQTLPRHYRFLWSRIFKETTYQESCSTLKLKEAESELIGAMMCQLVGRLKIRSDNLAQVNVHFYCVSDEAISTAVKHFRLEPSQIIVYEEVDIGIPSKEVTKDSLINALNLELQNGNKIILEDWIRLKFYNEITSNETIRSKIKENIGIIKQEAKKFDFEYFSPRGRGKKVYLDKVVGIH